MPLSPGSKVGPYEIIAPIGAGGMGEVYRARDTALKRDVALKVLPADFSNNADRMARFQREAEVLASLDHPNIGHIHGIFEAEGSRALALALIEGPTLAERIAAGPVHPEEALAIASQIVDALEYAHERGVVHRDLKPANIKINPDGVVKVLDFGLAKVLEDEPTSASSLGNSPTLTLGHTRAGVILGTAAYMSPEQAVGRPVDRRSDIFSFGAVLYEMLTGQRAFAGAATPDVLEAVVKNDPDWEKLPSQTPSAVRKLLRRCLIKDRKQRLQAIGEARIVLSNPVEESAAAAPQPLQPAGRLKWLPWTAAAAFALAAAALGYVAYQHATEPPPTVTRFPLRLGEGETLTMLGLLGLAMSADGTQMVYAANNRLYLRSMAESDAHAIPGTDAPGGVTNPAFSPDGKSLTFWDSYDNTLKRIPVSGGTAVTICAASLPLGMTWTDGGIVFGSGGDAILRVSPNGGLPEPLVTAKVGELIADPQMLPGGETVLFVAFQATSFAAATAAATPVKAQIIAQTLKSGARKILVEGESPPRYLPTGHLAYAQNGVLFAVPFDARRLEITGSPVAIMEGVARAASSGEAQIAFSNTGSLIYVPGPANSAVLGQTVLGLVDRKGEVEPLKVSPGNYRFPRVSRDGKLAAYQVDDNKESSIWIWELSGAAAPRRLTLPGSGSNSYPVWSSDNQRVAFQSDRERDLGIWWQRADGTGTAERLTKPDKGVAHIPDSWSPDGQTFSFTETKNNVAEVWTYSLRDKKATVFASAPGAVLSNSVFSPDGHWLAYQLSAQPNSRIYLRPFPRTETEFVAPVDADTHHPVWSPDGKELLYVAGPSMAGSMSVSTQPSVRFGTPLRAPRSGFNTAVPASVRTYDILPDGKRFLGVVPAGGLQAGPGPAQIRVVLNWFEEVKQRAPGR